MSQVGTGDRSEKIKTYNYKDSRCSDHRLKQNFDLNKQLDGEIEDNIQVRRGRDRSCCAAAPGLCLHIFEIRLTTAVPV